MLAAWLNLVLWLLISCPAAAVSGALDYQVGDKAATDIVTPLQLVVVDHDRTEALRQQEAQRVPAIFRFNTNSAAEAEVLMLSAYHAAKEGFLKTVERNYKRRRLDPEAVAQERFGKVIATYQKQNRAFPLNTNLATLWALGEADQVILEDLSTTLRDTMRGYVRADTLSTTAKLGPQTVRVLSVGSTNAALELDAALAQSIPLNKTNFLALNRARKDLQARFGPAEQWAGRFLAGFVRENCVCDEALTIQNRARRSDPILAADTYEPGTVIVRAGTLIDFKAKAALDELARRTEASRLQAQAAEQKRRAEALAAELKRAAEEERRKAEAAAAELTQVAAEQNRQTDAIVTGLKGAFAEEQRKAELATREWKQAAVKARLERLDAERRYRSALIWVGVAAITMTLALWFFLRRRQSANLLPVLASGDSLATGAASTVACPSCHEPVLLPSAAVRERVLPELARWLKTQFVQRLLQSRSQLTETQRLAALQVAELEKRLEEVKGSLQDRLKAYEQRIADLEQELQAKGAENRELLEATIKMARERLEARRQREGMAWN